MRRLSLLGPACVDQAPASHDGGAIPDADRRPERAAPRFRSQRTVALLGYLVAERRSVARSFLAALLWPDETSSKGRSNLRRELYNLAQVLPDCWKLDRQAVTFAPSDAVSVDLYALQDAVAESSWQKASELLRGDFLEGLHLDDNLEYQNWLLVERERWRGHSETVLSGVIERHLRRGRYAEAHRYTERMLQLAPWNEEAHRQAMRLLAWTGRRGAALRQFEICKDALRDELAVEPSPETVTLHQQIHAGVLHPPPQVPTFLTEEGARREAEHRLFVGREGELAQLDAFLTDALAGSGGVVFVTGGPGSGKSALLSEFGRRAMSEHRELLVASGNCSAYSGVGDPYLPFRDVMGMLTGDVESKWDAGAIDRDHAERLWTALPLILQSLLDRGSDLLDVLVPAGDLLSRATIAEPAGGQRIQRLREQIGRRRSGSNDVEQSYLFQQVTNVLRAVAKQRPLLLFLDDLQWADVASVGLLFHLGRRLAGAGNKVLIVCAYRPEEVGADRSGDSGGQPGRHSLAGVLSEFKRLHGDVWVDLDQTGEEAGRRFVDALLDSEPNSLGKHFRDAMYRRTEGHALFTVELLRSMQDRGDLRPDEQGRWVEGPSLDWDTLPAKVGAVIAERFDRLDPALQEILTIGSIEGEVFTAQVVSQVLEAEERPLLQHLSRELERGHRLVREQEELHTGERRLSRYRFGHVLFQDHIYRRISQGERRLLHREVAAAIEDLYRGRLDDVAVRLALHFRVAEDQDKAFEYIVRAAERASRLHANDEAVNHYARAIDLAERALPDAASLAKLRRGRGLALETLGEFDQACIDHNHNLQFAQASGDQRVEWRALVDLGKLWRSRDYQKAHVYFVQALGLARQIDDPAMLARSMNWMGNWYANAEQPSTAIRYHTRALEIVERLGSQRDLVNTLDLLGVAHLLGADLSASIPYYDRSIALCQELNDQPRLVTGLIARAANVSVLPMLTLVPPEHPPDAVGDLERALTLSRDIGSLADEAWAYWALALVHLVHGEYGAALEAGNCGLGIAQAVGHREYSVTNHFALALLHAEFFSPEQALAHGEAAQELADDLHSQLWFHYIAAVQAGSYLILDDHVAAQGCLEAVLSPSTPMDALGNRLCWARKAELALAQGDPMSTLDITERLIASAPGISAGRVITFLWKLKAEALTALGRAGEAELLLRAALQNVGKSGERFLLWRLHSGLGQALDVGGQKREAASHVTKARRSAEELADTLPTGELRCSFFRQANRMIGP